jgi:phosphatidylglycerophosphate synthase
MSAVLNFKSQISNLLIAMSSVLTVANFLTILRLILIPAFVTTLYYQRFALALGIFLGAAITDCRMSWSPVS